ncbi:MAG: adenylate/guanylate cyclase domain-containing protein [Planctomycetes bacterium]|nr:adenylate/guanylate cyclase domain-containing protein [Planctomycetota bacterium]
MINLETAGRNDLVQEIQNLRRQLSAVQGSQVGQMRSIVGLDEKVIQLDEKDHIEYVNNALAKMMNLTRDKILGKHISAIDEYKWGKGELQHILNKARQSGGEFGEEKNYFDEAKEKYFYVNLKCSITGGKAQVLIEDLTEKKMLEKTFRRYVSPEVIERMLEIQNEKDFFKAERNEITVLFGDLRGFTTWSESSSPDKVRDTINEYLSAMTDVVLANKATLDKFVGDEVMVLFGAPLYYPDHAVRALKVAIEMQEAHQLTMENWRKKGLEPLAMGIEHRLHDAHGLHGHRPPREPGQPPLRPRPAQPDPLRREHLRARPGSRPEREARHPPQHQVQEVRTHQRQGPRQAG